MKIVVFTDIHGNVPALKTILEFAKNEKADEIISLGDNVGIGPQPNECLDLVVQNNVQMCLGNHELYFVRGINSRSDKSMTDNEVLHHTWVRNQISTKNGEFVKNCKISITKQILGKKLSFQHFMIDDENAEYPFHDFAVLGDNDKMNEIVENLDCDYLFIGHEHLPFERTASGKKLIDIGSSGCTFDNRTHCTIIEDIDGEIVVRRVDLTFDRAEFDDMMLKINYPIRQTIAKNFFGMEI